MAKEIERKFLLKELPEELYNLEGKHILQGYISTDPEVRVREKGNKFFLTRKIGSGLTREETELEISENIFGILWDATKGRRIEKIRYKIDEFEIDKYLGKLEGFYIVEIELETEDQKFEFPDCLKKIQKIDVTEDPEYKNQSLAVYKPNSKKIIETVISYSGLSSVTYELWFTTDFKYVVSKSIYSPLEEEDGKYEEIVLQSDSREKAEVLYRKYIGEHKGCSNVCEKREDYDLKSPESYSGLPREIKGTNW